MNNVVADLHVHTTRSDGKTDPEDIPKIANSRGLDAIAVTDHNTYYNSNEPVIEENGVHIINGMELRVEPRSIDERIDVLGYGIEPDKKLEDLLNKIGKNRKERANKILEKIEDKTGIKLRYEPTRSTGRPHIARAIAQNSQLEYDYNGAFENLIGRDCPCYVPREVSSFEEGIEVLQNCSMYTSLAHPYRYDNVDDILELAKNLDAVECRYPYDLDKTIGQKPQETAKKYNLGITGGSDAHKTSTIGSCGLNEQEFTNFIDNCEIDSIDQN